MSGGSHSEKAEVWLRCAVCGNEQPIWRNKGNLKEKGHVKHMWCHVCREVRPHVEMRGK